MTTRNPDEEHYFTANGRWYLAMSRLPRPE
jgi:hypothetical protein